MFESAAAAVVLSANDFSVSISLQIESDAEKEFLFSAREKLDMRRSRQAAKLDMIAITCNNCLLGGCFGCFSKVMLIGLLWMLFKGDAYEGRFF